MRDITRIDGGDTARFLVIREHYDVGGIDGLGLTEEITVDVGDRFSDLAAVRVRLIVWARGDDMIVDARDRSPVHLDDDEHDHIVLLLEREAERQASLIEPDYDERLLPFRR